MKPLIMTPNERPDALQVLGTQIIVLASIQDTNGTEITLQSGEEGMGPPPHSHAWDESFYVLNGQIEFNCAGNKALCPQGSLVHVPAGTVHAFSYGVGGGKMLEITEKGQATAMFKEFSEKIPPGAVEIPKVVEVFNHHGVTLHLE